MNKQLLAGTFIPENDKKKKPKKITNQDEIKEINMMNATCKALRKKLQAYTKAKGGLLASLVPLSLLIAAASYYVAMNCCQLEWCTSNKMMHDLLKCR